MLVFDLIPFKCDYLSALNDFEPGFFRETTTACLVPGTRPSVSYPFSTLTIWTTILLIKVVEVISLKHFFPYQSTSTHPAFVFKDYLQQKTLPLSRTRV